MKCEIQFSASPTGSDVNSTKPLKRERMTEAKISLETVATRKEWRRIQAFVIWHLARNPNKGLCAKINTF